jgi:hypothetical protein
MQVYSTDFGRQSRLAVARRDDRHISDAFETLPTALLSGSDELMSLDIEDDNTSHLLRGKWHTHADDFVPTFQMGYDNAHGQPRTRGPTTIVWYCSECGDGPYGMWQNICQRCTHVVCGSCVKEET